MATARTIVSKDVLEKLLDVEKLQYCYECGICTGSCPIVDLLGENYNPRGLLEKILLNPENVLTLDELWFCAWCYRCQRRCNQALALPEIFLTLRKIAAQHGNTQSIERALRKIAENIPLPLITTSVCFHPERAGLDKKNALDKIEQFYKEHLKKEKAKRAQEVFEEKVAIIGSGPAGLTVAYELSRRGFDVVVFEALPEAGGMLRKCIPDSRMSKQVLRKEIQLMEDFGVEIKTGITIGRDLAFSNLWREGYKAIFVGVGAHESQKLKIEGVELKGVVNALEFLWTVNSGEPIEVGKNVAVIGGGNVAMDVAQAALECGAKQVTVLYRRSREEMPAIPWEVKEAEDKGIKVEFLVSPKKIVGEKGAVAAIECVRMELGEPDESGRRKAIPITGSEFKQETDMVILAIGETPNLSFLPKEIELNENGTIWVDPITMETSLLGVFAGGDDVTGPATVIEAVQAGKHAAESIESYLKAKRMTQ